MSQLVPIGGPGRIVKRIDSLYDVDLTEAGVFPILSMLRTCAFHGALVICRTETDLTVAPSVQFIAGGAPVTDVVQLQALEAGFGVWVPPYAIAGVNQAVKLMTEGELFTVSISVAATASELVADIHVYGTTVALP